MVLCVLAGRKRAVKTLKPSFFVSGVVGTFVGFPRNKRVVDGYARCRLCRVDLSIAGRGLHNLWDHWKGREHTRLEQRFRIMSNMPLLDKSCRPVSLEEDRRIRAARVSEPPVILESDVKLTVEERIAIEREEEAAGAKPELSESSASYLWLCCFISNFVELQTFPSVVRAMESWVSSMRGELVFAERALSYPKCQVIPFLSFCLFFFFFCLKLLLVCLCLVVFVRSWIMGLSYFEQNMLYYVVSDMVFVLLQSLVLYGLYPFVVEKVSDLLSSGVRFGLHVRTDGPLKRVDCHIFASVTIKVVVLVAIPGGAEWEQTVLRILVSVLACVESHAGLCAISVGENLRLGRALASIAHPIMPVVTRRLDVVWLRDLLRRTFLQHLSGLEPFCVLEYFRFRLSAVIGESSFDNMPRLREVIQAVFSHSGWGWVGLVCMCFPRL